MSVKQMQLVSCPKLHVNFVCTYSNLVNRYSNVAAEKHGNLIYQEISLLTVSQ